MALTLITGRANSGKSGHVVAHVEQAAREGRTAWLLLPSRADVNRASEELAHKVAIGVSVDTVDGWITSRWTRFGDGRRLIDGVTRGLLVAEVCRKASGSLAALSETAGFARLMERIVYRSAGFDPQEPAGDQDCEIAELVREYRRAASGRGLVEIGEATRLLQGEGLGQGQAIAAHRFTDLSASQESALCSASLDNEVLIALTWEAEFPATECMTPLVERLVSVATRVVALAEPAPRTELDVLESEMFRPAGTGVSTGAVVLGESSGAEAETVLIAEQVAEVISEGVPPERIAVCFRDLAARRAVIGPALAACEIDYEVDLAIGFATTRLGQSLAGLVGLAAGQGSRRDAIDFLAGPLSGVGREVAERTDAELRRRRVNSGPELLNRVAACAGTTQEAARLAARAARTHSPEGWQNLVAHLLAIGRRCEGRAQLDVRLDASAGRLVTDAAMNLDAAGIRPSATEFIRVLQRQKVSTGSAERAGAVLVTEAHRLRSRRFDVLVMGGLNASEFSSEKREPLASEVLRALGVDPGVDDRTAERFLFYTLATRARSRLVLTRQATTADGKELRSSAFWEDVLDIYRSPELASRGVEGSLTVTQAVRLSDLARSAPCFSRDRRSLRQAAALGTLTMPDLSRGYLDHAASLVPEGGEFRVTELERYHACPYSWFYAMRLRPRTLDVSFDPRARGTIAHRLVQEFYDRWRSLGHARVTPENLDSALETYREVASDVRAEAVTLSLGEELALDDAEKWVRRSLEQDAGLMAHFAPTDNEWRFGAAHDRPFTLAGISLRGSIDRIDTGPSGIVVTDYKSSAEVTGRGQFESNGLFQVVVYGQAASQITGLPVKATLYRSLRSGDMRGWYEECIGASAHLSSRDAGGAQEWADLVGWASQAVTRAVEGIRAGCIEPRPRRDSACTYCEAASFCREARS